MPFLIYQEGKIKVEVSNCKGEYIMDCVIRKAELDDYEQVLKIMNQAQQLHVEWRPDIYKRNDSLLSREIFGKKVDDETFFVAEMSNIVVGIMELVYRHIETPAHVTRNVIFIDVMAIDEANRRKGVGHLLFEKVKELKEILHYDGIELQVNAKNKAAYEMYSKYGFTEKSISMELL